jgi:hypothetical protein
MGKLGQMASKVISRWTGWEGESSPESSMGSLSADLRTWSDSPVRELSSILRSLPWMSTPSAGSRSPKGPEPEPEAMGPWDLSPHQILPAVPGEVLTSEKRTLESPFSPLL